MPAETAEIWRQAFEVPDGIYLLNHSVGCLPRSARAATLGYLDGWAQQGSNAWGAWLASIEEFRQRLAQLFGVTPEACCPQSNISSALVKLVHALPRRPGRNRIVLGELDFPSIGFVLEQLRRSGYELVYVPAEDGRLPLASWERVLDERVALAHVTHVVSESGYRLPVADICRLARQHGIFSVVDVAQSVGVVPIDIAAWQADAVIGSCVKWLCGGSGAGFLWLDPARIAELEPVDVGWFSHAQPFEFDIHRFELARDARRFWGGTPAVLPFVVAAASLAQILSIGVPAIQQHNQALAGQLISAVRELGSAGQLGLRVRSPLEPDERGGTVVIDAADRERVAAHLRAHGIQVDQRPRFGLRLSPHIYNTPAEMTRVCEHLAELARA